MDIRYACYKAKPRQLSYELWREENAGHDVFDLIKLNVNLLHPIPTTDIDILGLPPVFTVYPDDFNTILTFINQCHMSCNSHSVHNLIHIL